MCNEYCLNNPNLKSTYMTGIRPVGTCSYCLRDYLANGGSTTLNRPQLATEVADTTELERKILDMLNNNPVNQRNFIAKLLTGKPTMCNQNKPVSPTVKAITAAIEDNNDKAVRLNKEAELLANDHYAAITGRGNAMITLPDPNVRMILPKHVVDMIQDHVTFVQVSNEEGKVGQILPVAAQLNVTYFTG